MYDFIHRVLWRLLFEYAWSTRWRGGKGTKSEYLRLYRREIVASLIAVEEMVSQQKREVDIVSERLERRFDPSAAMNEAFNRAQAQKKDEGPRLTGAQLKALEFQKAYLERISKS